MNMITRRQTLKGLVGTAVVAVSGCSQLSDNGNSSTEFPEPQVDDVTLQTPANVELDTQERGGGLQYVAIVSDDQEGTAWVGLFWRDNTTDERADSPAVAEMVEYSTESTTVELAPVGDTPPEFNDATIQVWPNIATVTITNNGPSGNIGVTALDSEDAELASTTTEIEADSTITLDLEIGRSTPVDGVSVVVDPGVSQE